MTHLKPRRFQIRRLENSLRKQFVIVAYLSAARTKYKMPVTSSQIYLGAVFVFKLKLPSFATYLITR